ncbi:MAG: DUF1573 domain-containing protein [Bacteroides sp.]|nr:DUF1573 domain-containing protein [Bacteroides sp.]
MRLTHTLIAACAALAASAAPAVRWTSATCDFGAFSEDDGPRTARFGLINAGDEPLAILAARATCGCTTPRYPREAAAPGDTIWVEVTYDPGGRPGRFAKKVYVETNTEPSRSTLTVRGTVIGAAATVARRYPADLGPLKLSQRAMMIGEVYKDRLKTVYFDGYNRSDDSLRVEVTHKPAWLDITVAPAAAPPGEQVSLIAYANTSRCPLYGLVEDSVTISPRHGEHYTLPVTMLVAEDFSTVKPADAARAPVAILSATTLDAGSVARTDGEITRTFTISNSGRNPLKIRRVYSSDLGVEVRLDGTATVKRGKHTTVTVKADPSAAPSDMLNARVSVITNDPVHPVQTVRLTAMLH